MKNPAYVLDTHALVWFVKGTICSLGWNALLVLTHPRARVVVPSYALEEIQRKFNSVNGKNDIKIPPTALLRLLSHCSNIRVLPRGGAVLAREFQLIRDRKRRISVQDVPIAAAALVVRDYYEGPVVLITKDSELRKWASASSIPVVWNSVPFQCLPT